MTRHFGVLIPSTNTTGETEYTRLLPAEWQPHYARVKSASIDGSPFSPPLDADVDYKAKLLAAAGVPAFASAMAIGEAMQALGTKRMALVSPYSEPVNASARRYYEEKYGLSVVALEGFAATDSYAIGGLGPEMARDAFARIDRPEIDAFIVPGGNFPTMASIPAWEREFNKPVVTTNQAAFWAVTRRLGGRGPFPGLGGV